MSEELFRKLTQAVIEGEEEEAEQLVKQALEQGVDPLACINEGLMKGIEEVGELATELAEKGQQNKKEEEFADVFAWLCTLANISGVDMEKACRKYTCGNVDGFK